MSKAENTILEGYPVELLNRSTNNMKTGDFYVSFLNISDNLSNILGRQVYSVNPPELANETTDFSRKGETRPNKGRYKFDPITIEFRLDSFGIVMDVMLRQYLRENGLLEGEEKTPLDSRFDIQIEYLSPYNNSNHKIIYKRSLLTNLGFPNLKTSSSEDAVISTTFVYDNVDVRLKEWV